MTVDSERIPGGGDGIPLVENETSRLQNDDLDEMILRADENEPAGDVATPSLTETHEYHETSSVNAPSSVALSVS